jgi:hypothetical protein
MNPYYEIIRFLRKSGIDVLKTFHTISTDERNTLKKIIPATTDHISSGRLTGI